MPPCFAVELYPDIDAIAVRTMPIAAVLTCSGCVLFQEVRRTIIRRRGDDLVNSAEKGYLDRCERCVTMCLTPSGGVTAPVIVD